MGREYLGHIIKLIVSIKPKRLWNLCLKEKRIKLCRGGKLCFRRVSEGIKEGKQRHGGLTRTKNTTSLTRLFTSILDKSSSWSCRLDDMINLRLAKLLLATSAPLQSVSSVLTSSNTSLWIEFWVWLSLTDPGSDAVWLANNDKRLNRFMTLGFTCMKQCKIKRWQHAVRMEKHHETTNKM